MARSYLNLFSGSYGDYDPSLSARRAAFRTVPQLLLKEALDRAETLRRTQAITLAGKNYEALSFVDANQQIVTLYFNADSKLLYKSERVFKDSVHGDSVVESLFEDDDSGRS